MTESPEHDPLDNLTDASVTLIRAAYGLLGDGAGGFWDSNPEYTRGIVELISTVIGAPEERRGEVIELIRAVGLVFVND